MGILDQAVIPIKEKTMKQFIKNLFGIKDAVPIKKEESVKLSAKEIASANKEPWVAVLDTHVNKDNIRNGFFELDWNEKFILNLIRAGYKIKTTDTDNDIVDRWWIGLCRATVLETFDQEMGDPDKRNSYRNVRTKDLGDGRTEVS